MSSIARHDILNKLTAVYGGLALLRSHIGDPTLIRYLDNRNSNGGIKNQIEFTRDLRTWEWKKLTGDS